MSNADAPIQNGKVKFFNARKGYGFIVSQNREIFLHISEVDAACDEPQKGDRVVFVEGRNRDGRPAAKQIVIVRA